MALRAMSCESNSIFVAITVFQSLSRTPPVSPEFGFHAQNVQLVPFALM